mmetsp:Transcript_116562/g.212086  ORF Transcript_116562/g.212086 Transcript_116562/m.212086 type:complete len:704 (+) Transcript_116562:67-2178(+)
MGCGASAQRFILDESVPFKRKEGIQRSVDIGNGVYRKKGFEGGLVGIPPDAPEVKTAWDIVLRSAKVHEKINCLGVRRFEDLSKGGEEKKPGRYAEYVWTTYAEFCQLAKIFGFGLVSQFPTLKVGSHVGVYGPSTLPLLVAQYGCFSQAITTTPMYDTWSEKVLQHVIVHADLEVMVVAQSLIGKIQAAIKKVPNLISALVVLPQVEYAEKFDKEIGKEGGTVSMHSYQAILDLGKATGSPTDRLPKPEADAVIMYTSGSSGLPKGVQLPHSGFVGVAQGFRQASKSSMEPGITLACFMPLGHVYPTSVVLACFLGGVSVGLYHGDPAELVDDLQAMKPDVIPGVPRIYQTIYAKATDALKQRNCLVQSTVDNAIKKQTANLRAGLPRDEGLDRKVFSQMQATLGGRVKYFTSGASKILPTLTEWLKVCFNASMVEGYGLTESYGCACVQETDWNTYGDVGAPLCCTEIKLHDVPDFGYSSKANPPRGELCLRGVNIMRGYYKDPEQTAKELKEGWLHTGDVAQRNEDGTFSIIDRISNVFKLGRAIPGVEGSVLIAPEVIENQLATLELVNQAWIFGSIKYPHLVAVIVPQADKLLKKAGSSIAFGSPGWQQEVVNVCEGGNAEKWVKDEVSTLVRDKKIKHWEEPVRIHLESKLEETGLGFTIDNELLTNTFKLRRGILKKHYDEILLKLYQLDGVEWKK